MPGLYIHIPFCVRKCLYCDFYSLPMGKGPLSKRLREAQGYDASRFLDALEMEMDQRPPDFQPETIFVGGGTPTELSDGDFARSLEIVRARVDMNRIVEWTCESNPGTLTRTKAELMKDAGVNRVSLGVQSFDPKTLEFLGRIHSADEAESGYHLLREAGFDNINLDLMYGVPGTPTEIVASDLDRLIQLSPAHTSCYCLIFENGTPLTELRAQGFVKEVDDDTELDQYNLVRGCLAKAGYRHYEISNFAQPGRECRHNLWYWGGGEYLGFGPSAHSHWAGRRYGNVRNLETYCTHLLQKGEPKRICDALLEPEAKARETLVMGLRRLDGVSRADFLSETGFDYRELCGKTIEWLTSEGLLEETDTHLRLTENGLFVSDGIFSELV